MAEDCQRLLDRLGHDQLRTVALGKVGGCSDAEIAPRLDCTEITVERRLRLICKRWEKEMTP